MNQHFVARSNFATNKIALCNQYLVARTNIGMIRLVALGSNAVHGCDIPWLPPMNVLQ
jgi:hypothetical protein